LTDVGLGLNQEPVRITEIDEDEDRILSITAENSVGTAAATLYSKQNANATSQPASLVDQAIRFSTISSSQVSVLRLRLPIRHIRYGLLCLAVLTGVDVNVDQQRQSDLSEASSPSTRSITVRFSHDYIASWK